MTQQLLTVLLARGGERVAQGAFPSDGLKICDHKHLGIWCNIRPARM